MGVRVQSGSRTAPFLALGFYACISVYGRDQRQDVIRRVDATELLREANLSGYTVTEYYTIKNSHFSRPAEVTVETTYKRGGGKTYKVVSRSGPSLLANTVMDRLLRDERDMSWGVPRERAIITSANYDMKLMSQETLDGRICDVIQLTPKRRSAYLLKGRMWVDAANMMLVKIEGRPPASVSFFEGRPLIVREYKMIDGFALALHSHAASGNFLFGQSTVDIEYRDYHLITTTGSSGTTPAPQ